MNLAASMAIPKDRHRDTQFIETAGAAHLDARWCCFAPAADVPGVDRRSRLCCSGAGSTEALGSGAAGTPGEWHSF